jgi:hypothetical protein
VGGSDWRIYVFSMLGQPKPGWPRFYEGPITGTPSIGDPDRDGRAEIVFGTTAGRLRAVDMGPGTWNPWLAPWPTLHREYYRRGSTTSLVAGVSDDAGGMSGKMLSFAATPNPSASAVTFVVGRPGGARGGAAGRDDGVRIFSVSGRRLRTLPIGASSGSATVVWDGKDDHGHAVGPGIYFAHARWGGGEARFRLARLR